MIARSHRIWRLNRDWSNNYGEWKKRPYTVCLAKVTREDLFLLPRSIWFRNYGAPMELVSSKSHDNKRGCVAQSLFRTLLNHSLSLDLILLASRSRTRYDPLWSNLNHLIIANVDDLCFLPYYCSLWIPPVAEILLKYWRHIRWVSQSETGKSYCDRTKWMSCSARKLRIYPFITHFASHSSEPRASRWEARVARDGFLQCAY